MQYFININQKAFADYFPELDLIDAAIVSFIRYWTNNQDSIKLIFNKNVFVWASPKFVIDQMPILKIKTGRGITKRLEKICDSGLVSRHPDNQKMARSYYGLGPKFNLIIVATPRNESSDPRNESSDPRNESSDDLGTRVPTPRNESSDKDISRDNINKYNIREDTHASEVQKKKKFEKPTVEDLDAFFQKNKIPPPRSKIEAEKFFDHYESNGWKVGGKSQMKNWESSARNWMRNISKFQKDQNAKSNHKHSNGQLIDQDGLDRVAAVLNLKREQRAAMRRNDY